MSINGGAGQFLTKHAGTARDVQFFGFAASGADVGNYNIVSANSMKADITRASLVVSGLSAANKVYDGTAAAVLAGAPAVSPLGSDQVGLQGTAGGVFANNNVGNGKAVSAITGLSLSGNDSGNYLLVPPSGLTANITPKPLDFTMQYQYGTVYDGSVIRQLEKMREALAAS